MDNYFKNFDVGDVTTVDLAVLMGNVADNNFQKAQDAATDFQAQTHYTNVSFQLTIFSNYSYRLPTLT